MYAPPSDIIANISHKLQFDPKAAALQSKVLNRLIVIGLSTVKSIPMAGP